MGKPVAQWVIVAGTLFSLAVIAEPAPQQGPPPIEHFTRHDDFGTLKISPDGLFVAATTGRFGREYLVFIDLKAGKVSGGVRAPERFEIDDFYWVSPTRTIYMIAERQPGRVRPTPTGEIFGVDRDGGKNRMLYGYRAGEDMGGTSVGKRKDTYATAELISVLRDDPSNVLIAEYPWELRGNYWSFNPDAQPRITLLNIFNGKTRTLDRAPLRGAAVLADRNDAVRFASGLNDEMQFSVSWKPEPDAPWTAFDLPSFRPESLIPRRFTSDNASVLFTAVREEESLSALYRLDLRSRSVEKLHAFDDVDITGIVADFADREVVGVRSLADRPRHHWIAPNDPAARLHAALERAFPGHAVRVTSTSDDGRLAIVRPVTKSGCAFNYFLLVQRDLEIEWFRFADSERS